MRNFGAVLIAAVVTYVGILVIIAVYALAAYALLAARIGPIFTTKVTVLGQIYVLNALMFFIACIPAAIVVGLFATPTWRRKAGVIGGTVAWTVCLLQSWEVLFGDVPFALPRWFWVTTITQQIAGLLGAIAGAVVGAIIYQRIQDKRGRQHEASTP